MAESARPRVDRRRFLGGAGLLGAGAAGAGAGVALGGRSLVDDGSPRARAAADVQRPAGTDGPHQPGIAGRAPAYQVFTAYDLTGTERPALVALMRDWTTASRALMRGEPLPGGERDAAGLGTAGLTITVGLGASALRRTGLPVPAELAPLPAFSGEALDPARGGGDLAVRVCAEDPMVAFSAARRLTRLATGARPRWAQRAFLRTAAAAAAGGSDPDGTARNLMGQLDGTDNPAVGSPQFDIAAWATGGPAWMNGGSYLVCRRIRMLLDSWDRLDESGRERVIGRRRSDGAPLSGGSETTAPDFTARSGGVLVIPANSHVRLSHPQFNDGVQMVRRSYSYDDGIDADGHADAGLFFQCFQADPRTAFTAIQRRLSGADALNAFIRHEASAVFAIPPAPPAGGYLAQPLLES